MWTPRKRLDRAAAAGSRPRPIVLPVLLRFPLQWGRISGLVAEKQLGDFPPLACRHLLVSELFSEAQSDPAHPFTVRMQVANAMMIVSALHLDYERWDLALEHGSDRHSTFQDFKC